MFSPAFCTASCILRDYVRSYYYTVIETLITLSDGTNNINIDINNDNPRVQVKCIPMCRQVYVIRGRSGAKTQNEDGIAFDNGTRH